MATIAYSLHEVSDELIMPLSKLSQYGDQLLKFVQ